MTKQAMKTKYGDVFSYPIPRTEEEKTKLIKASQEWDALTADEQVEQLTGEKPVKFFRGI